MSERLVVLYHDNPENNETILSDINENYRSWLTVYGTGIDYPVVQGSDNEFYLNHDFNKNESSYGSLFYDSEVDLSAEGNLLIYGHHMKDGQMFGALKLFLDEEFFSEYGIISLENTEGKKYYEIFMVMIIPANSDDSNYIDLHHLLNKPAEATVLEMIKVFRERAWMYKELPVNGQDQLLFLVTCEYTTAEGRLLLCARKI